MVDVRDILLGAAEAIMKHGWLQGDAGSTEQGFCAAGAIGYTSTRLGKPEEIPWGMAIARLREITGFSLIAAWNDDPNTTAEDVILALKRAAAEDE